jgi:hypothetical protein
MQRQMLIRESAEQIPHLTQTGMIVSMFSVGVGNIGGDILPARGGKRMAIRPKKISGEHILGSYSRFEW